MGDSPTMELVPRYLAAAGDLLGRAERNAPPLRTAGALLVITGVGLGISLLFIRNANTPGDVLLPTGYGLALLIIAVGSRALIESRVDAGRLYRQRVELESLLNAWQEHVGLAMVPASADAPGMLETVGPQMIIREPRTSAKANDERS